MRTAACAESVRTAVFVPALCNRYGKTWAVIYLQLKNRLRILKINIKRVDFFGEKRYNNKLVGKEV